MGKARVLSNAVQPMNSKESQMVKGSIPTEELTMLLKRFGRTCMAYSSLQEGVQHFVVSGVGYISYATLPRVGPVGPLPVALSDPVSCPTMYKRMTEEFLRAHPGAMFVQISREYADVLDKLGYSINNMGGETEIDVAKFTYSGHAKRGLRQPPQHAKKAGLTVIEVTTDADLEHYRNELVRVSDEWEAARGTVGRKAWFINRRPVLTKVEPGVRRFAALHNGSLVAWIFFDPMYQEGQVVGYYANITRHTSSAHTGTLGLIIKEAMEKFKKTEPSVKVLSLGMSPFHNLVDDSYRYDEDLRRMFLWLMEKANDFYPYKGLALSKAKYGGGMTDGRYNDPCVAWKPVYMAHTAWQPRFDMYRLGLFSGFMEPFPGGLVKMTKIIHNRNVNRIRQLRSKLKGAKVLRLPDLCNCGRSALPAVDASCAPPPLPKTGLRQRRSSSNDGACSPSLSATDSVMSWNTKQAASQADGRATVNAQVDLPKEKSPIQQ